MNRPTSPGSSASTCGPPRRVEWGLVLLIVLLGVGFRAAFSSRLAVEHFDEGVYSSNVWFEAEQRYRYPARHLYAPPLLPSLVEWTIIAFGPSTWGTMLVGILAGSLTVGIVWWLARSWFGIPAGLAAGTLAAFSEYHVLFSRTVLTEPLLVLFLVTAVYFLWRALEDFDRRALVLAGLGTGLAWATKYNGWLPLAIGTAGLAAWSIRPQHPVPARFTRWAFFLGIGLVAVVVWSPVWWGLLADGGYQAVQENHRRYVVGFSGWPTAFQREWANHRYLDGPLTWCGMALAVVFAGVGSRIEQRTGSMKPHQTAGHGPLRVLPWITLAVCVGAFSAWLGSSTMLCLSGLGWLIWACPWWRPSKSDPSSDLAYWLLAAWFVGLLLATPFYMPYPRLSLPWLVSGWLSAAAWAGTGALNRVTTWEFAGPSPKKTRAAWGLVLLSAGVLWGGKGIAETHGPRSIWLIRTGMKQVAVEIRDFARRQNLRPENATFYVYGEPALFFHLRAQGFLAVAPVADLRFADRPSFRPTFLVVGPHAARSPAFQQQGDISSERFEQVGTFDYHPSDLVLLDHFPPHQLNDPTFNRQQTIRLYRVKSR